MRYVFFGTPEFSVKILETLAKNNLLPVLIITAPDKPIGRKMKLTPSPAKQWAKKNNIPVEYDYSKLISIKPDLFVVASYGKIIPSEILKIPKYGGLNVHPSLLPKFRGASPIQSFILSGEKETGVTIMLMDEEMDHGPILAQQELEIRNSKHEIRNLYYKELEEDLAELGGKLLVEIIPDFMAGKIKPIAQDHSKATFTKKITKEDGLIDIKNEPAEIIERKIRAFTPWPGAYFFVNPVRSKTSKTSAASSMRTSNGVNGKRLIITKAELTDSGLKIERLKPEGKKEMNFEDYLRGNPNIVIEKYL